MPAARINAMRVCGVPRADELVALGVRLNEVAARESATMGQLAAAKADVLPLQLQVKSEPRVSSGACQRRRPCK